MDDTWFHKSESFAKNIYAQLNNFVDLKSTLNSIIKDIKSFTGADAISVRLFDEGDYPYFVSQGFSKSFLDHERSILAPGNKKTNYQQGDSYQLRCLCGVVASGNTELLEDLRSESGSLRVNNSTDELPARSEELKGLTFKNYCNSCGYESIGLFLIKVREQNIGVLQINHREKDLFTDDLSEWLDTICAQIGIAVENAMLFDKLKNKNLELESMVSKFTDMQGLLMEAKKTSVLADLVASLTHEIFSPITTAFTSASQMQEMAQDLSEKDTGYTADVKKILEQNNTALENIGQVRELIMGFKAIALDQLQESRQLINLKDFIETVIKVITPSFTEMDVAFKVKCRKKIEILGFSGVISQVLTQLINNSYEHGFHDSGAGEVIIGCKTVPGDMIELTYADNGKGLESETSHKVFEAFFTTDRKNHTGLGLTIVHNLVTTKLKGTIEIDYGVDEGLAFVITFPY